MGGGASVIRIVQWTFAALFSGLLVLGSVALAQWKPREYEVVRWFQPPAIPASDLEKDWDQEVCFWVRNEKTQGYRVADYYPVPDDWREIPKRRRGSVWEEIYESFEGAARWRR